MTITEWTTVRAYSRLKGLKSATISCKLTKAVKEPQVLRKEEINGELVDVCKCGIIEYILPQPGKTILVRDIK